MGKKKKRQLSAAERAAKRKRRQEYETIFVRGKQKRVRRPPSIDGMSVDEFIRANADPIFLHQEGLWDYLESDGDMYPRRPRAAAVIRDGRESVSFITVDDGDDLIVAFAVDLVDPGEIASLILQRTPKYEALLPSEERGVSVSHELHRDEDRDMAQHIVVDGSCLDIETRRRSYRLDVARVAPSETDHACEVLRHMHRHGGFTLAIQ